LLEAQAKNKEKGANYISPDGETVERKYCEAYPQISKQYTNELITLTKHHTIILEMTKVYQKEGGLEQECQ